MTMTNDDDTYEVRALARRIAGIESQVREMGRGSQAAFRGVDIDDGSVTYFDGEDEVGEVPSPVWIGPIPVPTDPVARATIGGVVVMWDGTFIDDNWRPGILRVEVHRTITPDATFISDETQVHSFTSSFGGEIFLEYGTDATLYYWLQTVVTGEIEGVPSGSVPQAAVMAYTDAEAQALADALAQLDLDLAQLDTDLDQLQVDLAGNTAVLATLNNVTLPNVQANLAAANLDLQALDGELAILDSELATAFNFIDDVETAVAQTNTTVASVIVDVDDLYQEVDVVAGDVSTVASAVNQINTVTLVAINASIGTINSTLTGLDTELDGLGTALGTLNNTVIPQINTHINQVDTVNNNQWDELQAKQNQINTIINVDLPGIVDDLAGLDADLADLEIGAVNLYDGGEPVIGTGRFLGINVRSLFQALGDGTDVTISYDLKVSIPGAVFGPYAYQNSGWSIATYQNDLIGTADWVRHSFTTRVKFWGDTESPGMIAWYDQEDAGQIIQVRRIKIERGNRATDWTPSAGDVALDRAELQSALDDLDDKFPIKAVDVGFQIGGGNLLIDSGFETPDITRFWQPIPGTCTFTRLPVENRIGYYARVHSANSADTWIEPKTLPYLEGDRWYTVSAKVYVATPVGASGGTRIISVHLPGAFFNETVALADGPNQGAQVSRDNIPHNVWTRIKITFKTPGGGAPGYQPGAWQLRVYAPTTGSNEFIGYDDIQIEEGEYPTAYAPKPDEILPDTINSDMLQVGSVITSKMTANTINGDRIATRTMTAERIVVGSLTSNEMTVNTITGDRILANSLYADKIVAGSITTDRMSANTINGDRITAGTLHADKIVANTITGDKIAANSIIASSLLITDFTNFVPDPNFSTATTNNVGTTYASTDPAVPQTNVPGGFVSTVAPGFDLFAVNPNVAGSGFPVREGEEFYVSAWVCHTGSNTGVLSMRVWCSTGDTYSAPGYAYPGFNVTAAAAQNQWIFVEGVVTIPANVYVGPDTAPIRSGWAGLGPGAQSGWWITQWNVRRRNSSTLIADGAVTTDKMTANSIAGDRIAANTLNATKIVAGSIYTELMAANSIQGDRIAANSLHAAKIVAGSISADKIAAGAITTRQLTIGSVGESLVPNGNFYDIDPTGVKPYGWLENGVISSFTYFDTDSVRWAKIDTGASGYHAIYQFVTQIRVSSGQQLYIEASGSSPAGERGWRPAVYSYGRDGTFKGTHGGPKGFMLTDHNGHGRRDGDVIQIPENPEIYYCLAVIEFQTDNTTYFVRDYQITRVQPSVRIENGAITADKVAANAITANKLNVVVGGENLLYNSSFETGGFEYWSNFAEGGGVLAAATVSGGPGANAGYYGNYRAILTSGAAGGVIQSFQQVGLSLVVGSKMTFSAYARGNATGEFRVVMFFLDANNNVTGSAQSPVGMAPMLGDVVWRRAYVTATVPAATTQVQVRLQIENPINGGAYAFDAAKLEIGDVVTAYSPKTDEILPGTVVANMVSAGAITTDKMSANSINGDRITANTLHADKITAGTISAAKIAAGAITTDKLTVASTGDNLIVNGNFRDRYADGVPMHWVSEANVHTTVGSNVAGDVTYLTSTTSSDAVNRPTIYQAGELGKINAVRDEQFAVEMGAGSLGGGHSWDFFMHCYNREGGYLTNAFSATFTTTDDFATIPGRKSAVLTVPPNGDIAYVRFGFRPLTPSKSYTFDRYVVAKVNTAVRIADGAITTDKLYANAVTANKLNVVMGGGNLVPNSNYENGKGESNGAGWQSSFNPSNNIAYRGTWSNLLFAGQLSWRDITGLRTGIKYTISVWVWREGTDHYLNVHDTAGNNPVTKPVNTAVGGWQRVVIPGWVATGTSALRIHFYANNGNCYIGAWQVEEGDVATAYAPKTDEILPGTINATMIQANAIEADKIKAKSVSADKLTIGAVTDNLVVNGNFYDEKPGGAYPVGWEQQNDRTYREAHGYAPGGVWMVMNAGPTAVGGYAQMWSDPIPVNGGDKYAASALLGTDQGGFVYLRILPCDAAGNELDYATAPYHDVLGNYWLPATTGNLPHQRYRAAGAFTVPNAARTIRVQFYWFSPDNADRYLTINDVTVRRQSGTTIIADGAITTDKMVVNTIYGDRITASTLNANKIVAGSITSNEFTSNTITGNIIQGNTLSGDTIVGNTLHGNAITGNTLSGNAIIGNTLSGDAIIGNTLSGNTIIGNTINAQKVNGETFSGKILRGALIYGGELTVGQGGGVEIAIQAVANPFQGDQNWAVIDYRVGTSGWSPGKNWAVYNSYDPYVGTTSALLRLSSPYVTAYGTSGSAVLQLLSGGNGYTSAIIDASALALKADSLRFESRNSSAFDINIISTYYLQFVNTQGRFNVQFNAVVGQSGAISLNAREPNNTDRKILKLESQTLVLDVGAASQNTRQIHIGSNYTSATAPILIDPTADVGITFRNASQTGSTYPGGISGLLDIVGTLGNNWKVARAWDFSFMSDVSFKDEIRDMEKGALAKVRMLRPRTYGVKDHDPKNRRMTGFIGQEVADAIPEAAIHTDEGVSVSAYIMMTNMVAAMKEMADEMDSLKAQVVALSKPKAK